MLILTRKIDQAIVIQGDIKIMVLGVERDRVKIGIDAPANVSVLREELLDQQAMPEPTPLRRRSGNRPSRSSRTRRTKTPAK